MERLSITMAYSSLRSSGPVVRVEQLTAEIDLAAQEMTPAIDALRAVGTDLEQDNLDAAWVDLDNAELELRGHESRATAQRPALGKALDALQRARESLAQAETGQASADIQQAIMVLSRTL